MKVILIGAGVTMVLAGLSKSDKVGETLNETAMYTGLLLQVFGVMETMRMIHNSTPGFSVRPGVPTVTVPHMATASAGTTTNVTGATLDAVRKFPVA